MKRKKLILSLLAGGTAVATCSAIFFANTFTIAKGDNVKYVISLNSGATKYKSTDTYIRGANPGILIKMNQNALEEVADSAWAQITSKGGYFEIASGKEKGSDIYGSIHGLTNLQLEFNNTGNSFTVYYGHDLNEEQTSIKKLLKQQYENEQTSQVNFDFNGTLPNYIRIESDSDTPIVFNSIQLEYSCNFADNLKTIHVETYPLKGGTAKIDGDKVSYSTKAVGTKVRITAFPSLLYKFVGWYNGAELYSSDIETYVTLNTDIILTATFKKG